MIIMGSDFGTVTNDLGDERRRRRACKLLCFRPFQDRIGYANEQWPL